MIFDLIYLFLHFLNFFKLNVFEFFYYFIFSLHLCLLNNQVFSYLLLFFHYKLSWNVFNAFRELYVIFLCIKSLVNEIMPFQICHHCWGCNTYWELIHFSFIRRYEIIKQNIFLCLIILFVFKNYFWITYWITVCKTS